MKAARHVLLFVVVSMGLEACSSAPEPVPGQLEIISDAPSSTSDPDAELGPDVDEMDAEDEVDTGDEVDAGDEPDAETTACENSEDCTAQVCSQELGYCVDCEVAADCGDGAHCIDFECELFVACDSDLDCTPLGLLCDKAAGQCVECVGHGDCPDVSHCASDMACSADVCEQGVAVCEGSAVAQCSAAGDTVESVVPCAEDEFCQSALCLPHVCVPASVQCAEEHLIVCADDGSVVAEDIDCTAGAQVCDQLAGASAPACVDVVCVPDVAECVGQELATCNPKGTALLEPAACEASFCAGGQCVPHVCAPDTLLCVGDDVGQCDSIGSGVEVVDVCEFVCLDAT